jgi:hypothetical protein
VPIDPIAVPEGIEEEVERMRALIEEVGVLQKQYMQARKGAAAGSDQVTPNTYLDDARAKLAGTSYSVIQFASSLILQPSIRRLARFRVYAGQPAPTHANTPEHLPHILHLDRSVPR